MFRPARAALLALATAAPLVLGVPAAHASTSAEGVAQNACPFGGVPPSSYDDVEGNTHEGAIDCLGWYGITRGVSATSYAPDQLVPRDQMATFLARTLAALRIPLPAAGDRFDDVDGNVHEQNIEQLAAAGIVAGTGERRYDPRTPITRAQMASLLRRTYDYASTAVPSSSFEGDSDYFSDDDGVLQQADIDILFRMGVVAGTVEPGLREDGSVYARGLYAPSAHVQRDQMASFVARLLGRGVLTVPGSSGDPYLRGTSVPLVDDFVLTVTGSDQDATQEVEAFDDANEAPEDGFVYVVYRVRVQNSGPEAATFDGTDRLVASNLGSGPGGPTYPASGEPCGRIPDPLQNPSLAPGESVEGNVCFEARSFSFAHTTLVDTRLGKPTNPVLTGFDQRSPSGGSEVSPYQSDGS